MIRLVLDTNNLVSAQISRKGNSAKIYNLWRENRVELLTSPFQLKELAKVLEYPRIKKKYHLTKTKVSQILKIIKRQAVTIYPLTVPKIVKKDPSDNQILAIGQEGKADFIISGDQHLLEAKELKGIPIITAKKLLKEII